ncbi:unnamed protein product [Strongylus vulgaris]|uniref:Uncharacterized protein n=1 Tax=Strongylus vulgaris TaxID=40348 RepID=A0A3P7LDC2_STRVU|nr:unnamed protein product [Strongylus vulgaris]
MAFARHPIFYRLPTATPHHLLQGAQWRTGDALRAQYHRHDQFQIMNITPSPARLPVGYQVHLSMGTHTEAVATDTIKRHFLVRLDYTLAINRIISATAVVIVITAAQIIHGTVLEDAVLFRRNEVKLTDMFQQGGTQCSPQHSCLQVHDTQFVFFISCTWPTFTVIEAVGRIRRRYNRDLTVALAFAT